MKLASLEKNVRLARFEFQHTVPATGHCNRAFAKMRKAQEELANYKKENQ